MKFSDGHAAAAHVLGGVARYAGNTPYILVELAKDEHASVIPKAGCWEVFWPWGDTERRKFTCGNLEAVASVLADLCATPRPKFQKGNPK